MKSNKLKREPKYIAKFKGFFRIQKEAVDAVKVLGICCDFFMTRDWVKTSAIDVSFILDCQECSIDTCFSIVTKNSWFVNWVNEFKDHTSIKPCSVKYR